jgi:hypothetical protein
LSYDNSLIAISQNLCTKQYTMSTLPFYIPLVFGVSIVMALYLFYRASGRSLTFLLLALGWIVLQGLLSATGFYAEPGKPLRFPLLLMPPVVFGLIFSYTPKGRRFFSTLDIRLLTLLQLIRLFVEPVLYWLSLYHLVPRVMIFEGRNFDILTGLTVPIIYYFGFVRRKSPTWIMMTWNWMGVGLLAVVVSIGVSSALHAGQTIASANAGTGLSPFAIQQFPWALLPGFLVPIAFFAHVGSIRLLAARAIGSPSPGTSFQ